MTGPSQRRQPGDLPALLEKAVHAWPERPAEAGAALRWAMELAQGAGYLSQRWRRPRMPAAPRMHECRIILIVGATGTLGGRIARDLLVKGKAVRFLVREPSPSSAMAAMGMATSADSLIAAGAQPIAGDMTDRPSLDAFIYTSAYGSDPGHPVPLYRFKAACEQALVESGMAWTVLLPHLFTEVWAGMVIGIPLQAGAPVTLVDEANHRHAHISEADVAAFAVAAVENPLAGNVGHRRRPSSIGRRGVGRG